MSTITTTKIAHQYRIDRPNIAGVMSDLRIPKRDLGPGDTVPAFDLITTDGGRVRSTDFTTDPRPMLLVFGSLTCPVTESGAPGLRDLHARYGDRVRFVMVNVREAHPGSSLPQPKSFEQKVNNATLLKAHHRFRFETAVDDIDGTLHRAFGPRPHSAYLIDTSGRIVFRAQWANVTGVLERALSAIVAKKTPPRRSATATLRSMAKMTGYADIAFAAAGKGAMRDTWMVAPPFGAMIMTAKLFGFLARDRRGLPAMTLMMLGMVAIVATAILL